MCHAACVSLVMGVTSSFTCAMSCHDSCVLCHVRGVCHVLSVMSHVSCHMRHVCVSCHVCQTKTGGADCKCAYAYNHALVESCHVFDVTCLFMSLMSAWCRLVSVHFVYVWVEPWLYLCLGCISHVCPLFCFLCCPLSLFLADMSLNPKWCTYPYIHTHTRARVRAHTHTCTHTHTHIHTQRHTHEHALTHTYTHAANKHLSLTRKYIHTLTH